MPFFSTDNMSMRLEIYVCSTDRDLIGKEHGVNACIVSTIKEITKA